MCCFSSGCRYIRNGLLVDTNASRRAGKMILILGCLMTLQMEDWLPLKKWNQTLGILLVSFSLLTAHFDVAATWNYSRNDRVGDWRWWSKACHVGGFWLHFLVHSLTEVILSVISYRSLPKILSRAFNSYWMRITRNPNRSRHSS